MSGFGIDGSVTGGVGSVVVIGAVCTGTEATGAGADGGGVETIAGVGIVG